MAKRRSRGRGRRVARAAGRAAMTGIRGAALQAATGAVAQLGVSALAARVQFVGQTWWAPAATMALVGVLMKRRTRLRGLGDAMLGAAGYSGAECYVISRGNAGQAEAGALYDTGMLVGGQFPELSDRANPTSSFYVPEGTASGDVSAAMAL